MKRSEQVSLRNLFLGLQAQMIATLTTNRKAIAHPGTKGDAAEVHWLKMLEDYLPARYCATKAFVLDSNGDLSEQIDIVIYDRQYSPFLFNQDNVRYVPAESVYAIFEVKQTLNLANLRYSAEKARSVRRLYRTSAVIPHAGGKYEPKPPPRILAGILCLENEWTSSLEKHFRGELGTFGPEGIIDLGCVLKGAALNTRSITMGFRVFHQIQTSSFSFSPCLSVCRPAEP
jgi:hypothetical protein